jgi:hypothetical protein
MSSRLMVPAIDSLLENSTSRRDGQWAYQACCLSRELHVSVWAERPPQEHVSAVMIPLLERLMAAVKTVPQEGEYAEHIRFFARNIGQRIENLGNYANGRPCAFPPDVGHLDESVMLPKNWPGG